MNTRRQTPRVLFMHIDLSRELLLCDIETGVILDDYFIYFTGTGNILSSGWSRTKSQILQIVLVGKSM